MKSFKAVEETRRLYHADSARNSVHRSSLLAPNLPGANLDISFLNHFLLKRGYRDVSCRVTEIDATGNRIVSRMLAIDEPRSYTLSLTETSHDEATDFVIEFFTGQNLFIPFPAVMVNHHGSNFLNSVHAYNRVLNDVFENDSISGLTQPEAAVDVRLDDDVSTFLVFSAGQSACTGVLRLGLDVGNGCQTREIELDMPRFRHRVVTLKDAFPDLSGVGGGILTVQQPQQFMFYGRMLAGQMKDDGAFSANHSYYDSSGAAEYWEDARPSVRLYPYFQDFNTRIRFYPILSPGRLRIRILPYDLSGRALPAIDAGVLTVPGSGFLDVSVTEAFRSAAYGDDVAAFAVSAEPLEGNTPTRVNHQLVFGADGLESSINLSLNNPNVYTPPGKKGMSWGQLPVSRKLSSYLGVTTNHPDGDNCTVAMTLYGPAGKLSETSIALPAGSARVFTADELLEDVADAVIDDEVQYLWFELRSDRPDVFGYSVTRHNDSGHCSGEHSF